MSLPEIIEPNVPASCGDCRSISFGHHNNEDCPARAGRIRSLQVDLIQMTNLLTRLQGTRYRAQNQ